MSEDYGRIKRNISKMIEQGAPESDIADYISEEGVTIEQLRAAPKTSEGPPPPRRSQGQGGWNPTVRVVKDGRSVASRVYPGVRITQVERDPNSALGRANPSSWHNNTSGAIDVDANSLPEGMTFDQYLQGYKDQGFTIVHAMNEDETRGGKRSGHATGNHWHVVLGPRADGSEEVEEIPNPEPSPEPDEPPAAEDNEAWKRGVNALVVGGYTTDQIANAYPNLTPEQKGQIDSWVNYRANGGKDEVAFGEPAPEPEEGFIQGAANSVGDIARGVGEGWDGFQNDLVGLGARATDAVGLTTGALDSIDRINNEARRPNQDARYSNPDGWSRTIGNVAGEIAAGAPLMAVRPLQALGKAGLLARVSESAIQGGLAGTVASGGHDIAKHTAIGAALGGGLHGAVEGIPVAKRAIQEAGDNRWIGKEVANNPQAPFHAEVAADIAAASKNEGISASATKSDPALVTKVLNNVEREYTSRFATLINQSKLPQIERERLKEALELKYSLSPEKIEALRGTPQGDAVADGILKTQAIRKMTEPHQRGAGGVVSKLANGIAHVADLTSLVAPIPGGPYVSQALRKLGRATGDQEVVRIAQARDVVKKAPRYAKLGEQVGPSGARDSKQALWDAAEAFGSEKTAATEAARAAKEAKLARDALARKEAMQRQADNKRVGVINDRDNIIPGGGFRGLIYEKTGLDPVNQDIGIQTLRQQGKITPEQYTAFLDSPDKLMAGNAGNAIMDRFSALAEAGKLQRSPKWTQPEPQVAAASPTYNNVDAKGNPIRSNPAYEAGVRKNIARQLQMEKELDELDPIQATFADGGSVRKSDDPNHGFDPDTLNRIMALKSALAAMSKTTTP